MNCWFCQGQIKIDNFVSCQDAKCKLYQVAYLSHERHYPEGLVYELFRVQLVGTLNGKRYVADYFIDSETFYITQVDTNVSIYKEVFQCDYSAPIITPNNFDTRLPTLITFS